MARPRSTVDVDSIRPMTSMRISKNVKERTQEIAELHGKTFAQQTEQWLMDGIDMNDTIKNVSRYLTEKNPSLYNEMRKPDTGICIAYVIKAVNAAIEEDRAFGLSEG